MDYQAEQRRTGAGPQLTVVRDDGVRGVEEFLEDSHGAAVEQFKLVDDDDTFRTERQLRQQLFADQCAQSRERALSLVRAVLCRAVTRVVALQFELARTKQLLADAEMIAAQVEQAARDVVLVALGEFEFCEYLGCLGLAGTVVLDQMDQRPRHQ